MSGKLARHEFSTDDDQIPESVLRALDEAFQASHELGTVAVAAILSYSTKTLLRLADKGQIRCRLKGTTHRLFARDDVEAHLRERYRCQSIGQSSKTARSVRTSTYSISSLSRSARYEAKDSLVQRARRRKRQLAELKTNSGNSRNSES